MGLGDTFKNLVHRSHKDATPSPATHSAPPTGGGVPITNQGIPAFNDYQNQQHQQQHQPQGAVPAYAEDLNTISPVDDRVKPEIRERAEQLVQQQRAAKTRLPQYDGLPPQYELIEKMGDGAFSHVYKAYDKLSQRMVAIKCVRKYELNRSQDGNHLHPGMRNKPRVNERANILKEVQIMRGLRHESIVELIEFVESNEHYYLVLELLDGGELFHQIVKLTYFSEDLARHVILQVAHGVRYLHEERGVVHRDIKPENLLFSSIPIIPSKVAKARPYDEEKEDEGEFVNGVGGGGIGHVKIADFGLSKVVWNEKTMTPCGTVGYTAPEIVKDERYSKSVDMWALGCVLYTLLCGFPPFYDESIHILTEKVAHGNYTFLSPWWDDISSSSKDLISNLLCVDPEKRFTIDEFLAHPWCNTKPAKPSLDASAVNAMAPHMKSLRTTAMPPAPLDSPLLQAQHKRTPIKSPGLHSLREAFDITYAVHRMEEEGARRRANVAANQNSLHRLNEEDEEDEIAAAKRKHGDVISTVLRENGADQMQGVVIDQQQQRQQQQQQQHEDRGRVRSAARKHVDQQQQQNNMPFQLNLDGATLLGRRQKLPPQSQQQQMPPDFPQPSVPAKPVTTVGSPMRTD